ncbi:purine nucleoside transporter PunC [Ferrimonas aestuarii]|uniref:Bcr/CflA family efflux transporter n=1 Tax=Ferrimonas aestuarii TaxID=2569539 RepID=A0A4U1BMX8_9GAMM|nr:purine nucleoside transporter PunC [Ferrimonas aestuarii]TKB54304.1 Bcr/CflA family multidrug efflux MFS transporter [Ferrimonas aestuarii]
MKLSRLDLVFLAGLSMISFAATDMYLPAFPQMEQLYNTGSEQIALSLSVFLAGMGVSQIIWGIISDRIGQRRALIAGLSLFVVTTLGLSITNNIWMLLGLRFVQAIGVCAAAVIWQAMVIKRYDASTAQRAFAILMPMLAISPALAPQIGVGLLHLFGVKSIFVALMVLGMVLVWASIKQPDDTPEMVEPTSTKSVVRDLSTIIRNPQFLGNALIYGFCSALFFAYLTAIPKIMTTMGYSSGAIGLSFVPQTLAFMLGGYLSKKGVDKIGQQATLNALLCLSAFAVSVLFMASQMPLKTIWPYLLPFMVSSIASGGIYPIVINRALSAAKERAATAAGLQNTLQIGLSFGTSSIVATYAANALPVSGFIMGVTVIGAILGYIVANPKVWDRFREPDNARVTHFGDQQD